MMLSLSLSLSLSRATIFFLEDICPCLSTGHQAIGHHNPHILKNTLWRDKLPKVRVCVFNTRLHGDLKMNDYTIKLSLSKEIRDLPVQS